MWEFHLLKPSSWTPICHSRDLNISNRPPLTVSSQHPLLPPLLPTQCKEPVQRAFLFFLFVCLRVWLGQIFCSSFPARPLGSLHSPAAVSSEIIQPDGSGRKSCSLCYELYYILYYIIIIMNYSFIFMLGAHRADTSLHRAPQRFHSLSVVRLRCPGFMSI